MKKHSKKKLSLRRETVQLLSQERLGEAKGGASYFTNCLAHTCIDCPEYPSP